MRYLVTTDLSEPFLTNFFQPENHWNDDKNLNMIVYDLVIMRYTTNGKDWTPLNVDHL